MATFLQRFSQWGNQYLGPVVRQFRKEWQRLDEKPLASNVLNRSLWQAAVPSLNFYSLLFLSAVIATMGLLANSAATIIGAMIVAPLMGPIIGIAFGMVAENRRLFNRSSFSLLTGVILTVLTAMLISQVVGLRTLGSEITARINPTLLDLVVALAAGGAGAFAKSRRGIADALPGVAIAVALVPPLSVVGIGLGLAKRDVATGAVLLFLTNLVGIIFSGAMVFLWQRYGSFHRVRHGLLLAVSLLIFLGLPLGFSLGDLLLKENIRRSLQVLLSRKTITFSTTDIANLTIKRRGQLLQVNLVVEAPVGSISEQQVHLVQEFLQKELQKPLILRVRVVPIQEFAAPNFQLQER